MSTWGAASLRSETDFARAFAPNVSEDGLVTRLRAGEPEAYEALAHEQHKQLYRTAQRILRNTADTEDVIQETYLRALTRLDQFAGRSCLQAWLHRITVNAALSHLRTQRRLPTVDAASLEGDRNPLFASRTPSPERQFLGNEIQASVHSAVEALPKEYRDAFVLREMEEMSTAEAAAALGISVPCLKTRLFRAKSLLRRKFRPHLRPLRRVHAGACGTNRSIHSKDESK